MLAQDDTHRPDLKQLFAGLADKSGKDYFQGLAEAICLYLNVDSVLVGVLDSSETVLTSVGTVWNKEPTTPIEYKLEGSPCAATLQKGFLFVDTGVADAFSGDQTLQDEAFEGYVGHALKDTDGTTLGIISAFSKAPATNKDEIAELAGVVAARTRAEMQHYVLSRKLRETLSEALLLNYSKSMFMANISHELRNPLSAIIGYASLIRDRQVDQRDTIEYATEICTAGEELLTLIGDILSLSSLEISGEYVKTVEFDLTDTARTGRRLLQEQAAAKNLRLLPISQTEPIRVKGDPTHTKKALLNILSNAVKYTSMGEIEISVESNDDGDAVISVRDSGVGMSAEQIEKANEGMGSFERAYSLHQDGGGLGFPLTFLLMERQGGHLEIESKRGIGTTVRLIFPESAVVETKGDFI